MSLRLDNRTKKRLEALSERVGISAGEIIRRAIVAALPEWENKGITLGHHG